MAQQRVVIIGGSSGIGLAAARRLDKSGAEVIIGGRSKARLSRAIEELGGNVRGKAVDASMADQVETFFSGIGAFDHLVLTLSGNEGIGEFRALDLAVLRRAFDAKFWPQLTAAQIAAKHIRGDGSLTFVTAISARTVSAGAAGLAAINGAIEAIIPTLAAELKPVRVNAVSPGVIDTPWWDFLPKESKETLFAQYSGQTPVSRVGKPDDIAQVIELLIRNDFMTGTVIECDGGLRIR